jgi:hypothetical protein
MLKTVASAPRQRCAACASERTPTLWRCCGRREGTQPGRAGAARPRGSRSWPGLRASARSRFGGKRAPGLKSCPQGQLDDDSTPFRVPLRKYCHRPRARARRGRAPSTSAGSRKRSSWPRAPRGCAPAAARPRAHTGAPAHERAARRRSRPWDPQQRHVGNVDWMRWRLSPSVPGPAAARCSRRRTRPISRVCTSGLARTKGSVT